MRSEALNRAPLGFPRQRQRNRRKRGDRRYIMSSKHPNLRFGDTRNKRQMIVLAPLCFTPQPPSANLAMRLRFGVQVFLGIVFYGAL